MSHLIAELTATINALGYAAGKNNYFVDTECKEAIRELIRFLRRDDETHEIRRYLGSAAILLTDLIPIVAKHHDDEEILDLVLRLLVNLTMPALLLYNEEPPVDKVSSQQYLEIVRILQQYKLVFAKQQIWEILSKKLSDLLKMDWAERGEEKSTIIVRILVLIRNVLHVPADTDFENRPDNDANLHDQVLWALHEGGMLDIILYIASTDDERQYFLHILEITSLMLRDQNAEVLASASVQRSLAEKERDMEELIAARRKDKEEKQKKRSLIMRSHPRFSGTYVVKGVKSISDNDLIVQSLDKRVALTFDRKKTKLKTPKNRQPMQSERTERRSAFSVRVLMKEFCIEFLNGAYNGLMHYVREMLHRGKAQANDESYFFWALRFFMEFNRHYKFEVKLISETMHVSIFHFTQERIENWRSQLVVDKKKFRLWSKRMHLGIRAYKELLMTLMKMYLHTDHTVKESAHTIMSNIFYVIEYRELLMVMMNVFDEIKFSKDYLKDLIEANHTFMKLLDHYCKRHRTLVVQKKGKSGKRKKKSKCSTTQSVPHLNLEPSEEKWQTLKSRVIEIFENNTELNVQSIPFDAASDMPFEEQKIEAMRRIRYFFLKSEVEEAVGLLRASREVWPENDCFGGENLSFAEECAALKEIFFADIGLPADANASNDVANLNTVEEEEEESDGEGADDQRTDVSVHEQSFDFMDFVKKFAKPKIVQACCLLLSQFEKNTTFTNHCVLKLLHRIAFDCKFAAILFQASTFRTFQRILNSKENRHKELKQFGVHIIRKFTEVAKRNTKVYIELLFWKGNKEAYEIEEGYGTLTSKASSTKGTWSEEQEDELRRLHSEYERDKPEREMVDWIQSNLIDQSRSRKGLTKKLRELGLGPAAGPEAIRLRTRPPKEFSEEEIAQITRLFNEFKDAYDIMGCIMDRLDVIRPKSRIIEKIMELGLVSQRSQLYKKRIKKSGGDWDDTEANESDVSSAGSASDSASDNEPDGERNQSVSMIPPSPLSAPDIIDKIKQVVDLDMKNAVEWILSSLEEALEDIGDEESDIPILPLADFSVKAMDNDMFQRLLQAIGIKQPVNFQEVYWRIPGTWQANDLRKRITIIQSGLSGNIDPSIDMNPVITEVPVASTSHEVPEDRLQNENSRPKSGQLDSAKAKKKRKRFNFEEFALTSTQQKPRPKKKKMSRIVREDDDSDEDLLAVNITKQSSKIVFADKSNKENEVGLANDQGRSTVQDDSDVEAAPILNSRVLSSSESDSEIAPKGRKEPKAVLDESEEESRPMRVSRILGDSGSDVETQPKSSQRRSLAGNSNSDDAVASNPPKKTKISRISDSDEELISSKLPMKSGVSSDSDEGVLLNLSQKSKLSEGSDSDGASVPRPSRKSKDAGIKDKRKSKQPPKPRRSGKNDSPKTESSPKLPSKSRTLEDSDSDPESTLPSGKSKSGPNPSTYKSGYELSNESAGPSGVTSKPLQRLTFLDESDSDGESTPVPSKKSVNSGQSKNSKPLQKSQSPRESDSSDTESKSKVSPKGRILEDSDSDNESVLPSQEPKASSDHSVINKAEGSLESVVSSDESNIGSDSQPAQRSNKDSDFKSSQKSSQESSSRSQDSASGSQNSSRSQESLSKPGASTDCDGKSAFSPSQKLAVSSQDSVESASKSLPRSKALFFESDDE